MVSGNASLQDVMIMMTLKSYKFREKVEKEHSHHHHIQQLTYFFYFFFFRASFFFFSSLELPFKIKFTLQIECSLFGFQSNANYLFITPLRLCFFSLSFSLSYLVCISNLV